MAALEMIFYVRVVTRWKKIGEGLHEIRENQLADDLKSPDEARAWVKRMLAQ